MTKHYDEDMIIRYVYNELNDSERNKFDSHLKICSLCSALVKEFKDTIKAVEKRERPEPSPELMETYQIGLRKIFKPKSKVSILSRIKNFNPFPDLVAVRRYAITALAFTIIGIVIGRWEFSSDSTTSSTNIPRKDQALQTLMDNYLVQTQVILHEIANFESVDDEAQIFMEQNFSAKLLQHTRYLKDYKKEEKQFVELLNQLELILLELSNMEDMDGIETIENVMILKDEINQRKLIIKIEHLKNKKHQLKL